MRISNSLTARLFAGSVDWFWIEMKMPHALWRKRRMKMDYRQCGGN
jgi:hypothetical protein